MAAASETSFIGGSLETHLAHIKTVVVGVILYHLNDGTGGLETHEHLKSADRDESSDAEFVFEFPLAIIWRSERRRLAVESGRVDYDVGEGAKIEEQSEAIQKMIGELTDSCPLISAEVECEEYQIQGYKVRGRATITIRLPTADFITGVYRPDERMGILSRWYDAFLIRWYDGEERLDGCESEEELEAATDPAWDKLEISVQNTITKLEQIMGVE